MITQTLHNPLMICNLMIATAPIDPSEQLSCASSCDYGFDLDEEELGSLAAQPSSRSMPQVAADEFESTYTWFIS
jgi:hypothetical protein